MSLALKAQLREMRKGLDLRPDQVDTGKIAPAFVPASFFALGNWPGPYVKLRTPEIGLAWIVLLPAQSMRYVDFAMKEHWEGQGLDWKALALRNLEEHSGENPGSHALRRANGDVYGVAFMFPDGIGPSRLLMREQLAAFFPGGYRVALPERSCAFAFSIGLEGKELATIQDLVDNCYQKGTRPLAPGTFSPDDLLPEIAAD